MKLLLLACGGALCIALACDRRVEPFVPGEEPQAPDLSKIFPAGMDRAERPMPDLPSAPGRGAPPAEEPGAPIAGTIELAAELASQVPPDAVLFLMARPVTGGPPVAAKRFDAPRFPLAFAIGAEDRMGAAAAFSGALEISARIDGDGNATTRSAGDLIGAAARAHAPGDRGVVVRIDRRQSADSSAGAAPPRTAAADSAAIEGTIALADALQGRVPARAVLFVIARNSPSGPPLAVVRVDEPQFPLAFAIGPGDRMIEAVPFAGEISLSARVDADGDAMTRSPGDLQGRAHRAHAPGDRDVLLTIDEVL
ncbi:MAG TPA: hypothetical protein VEC18_03110 [Myxococcota bacterium]|nr:hypothetical protein [Myxococcota bacterium]